MTLWFHSLFIYIDGVGYNLYHPFGQGRSCVVAVADRSVYLSSVEALCHMLRLYDIEPYNSQPT